LLRFAGLVQRIVVKISDDCPILFEVGLVSAVDWEQQRRRQHFIGVLLLAGIFLALLGSDPLV